MNEKTNLNFKISTGLKNIIGRELITDKIIAIFELVKNSYDAGATKVNITFNNIYSDHATISIADNGKGMNKQDLIDKWLFVAYSEKNSKRSGTYRDEYSKRVYAGAKGVGRFSCDRLGRKIDLYSKRNDDSETNLLNVDWDKFEEDAMQEFVNIPVQHSYTDELPNHELHGTSIVIKDLREIWNRESLLDLKKSLSRLINPYINTKDNNDYFQIFLSCTDELTIDKKIPEEKDKVNGEVKNYVFESLNLKTTNITVSISENGENIITTMSDRDTFLFEIKQRSKFRFLKNIVIDIFYLNRAAKLSFNKYMGISSAEFGSVFVYKNGFRVMPYGESGVDTFSIDRRKQQGYNRFLGTRDIMGRISILGANPDFIETSSRAGGFVNTSAFEELSEFFMDFAHKPLERYVVNLIAWGDEGKETGETIHPENIKKEIIKYITNYEKKGEVISININPDLSEIVDERKSKNTYTDINTLKSIAKNLNNIEIEDLARKVEQQTNALRKDRQSLVSQVENISEKLDNKQAELAATKKQAIFLTGLANPSAENAIKSMHLMKTDAESIMINAEKAAKVIGKLKEDKTKQDLQNYIFEIIKYVEKINGTFNTARYATYDIGMDTRKMNITDFVTEFVKNVFTPNAGEIIKVNIESKSPNCESTINPSEFGILIDNIVFNSYKAKAKLLTIGVSAESEWITINFTDDGVGIDKKISDVDRVFEMGFTTTNGSGVGLAHVRKIVQELNGKIRVDKDYKDGFRLEVKIKNEH